MAKKKKQIMITQAKQKQMVSEITNHAVKTATMLFLLAAQDELGLGLDELQRVYNRADLYAGHLENHLVKIKDMQEILKKNAGIKVKS